MDTNPTGFAAMISAALTAVLVALVGIGVLPWDDAQVTASPWPWPPSSTWPSSSDSSAPGVTSTADPKAADGTPLVPAGYSDV